MRLLGTIRGRSVYDATGQYRGRFDRRGNIYSSHGIRYLAVHGFVHRYPRRSVPVIGWCSARGGMRLGRSYLAYTDAKGRIWAWQGSSAALPQKTLPKRLQRGTAAALALLLYEQLPQEKPHVLHFHRSQTIIRKQRLCRWRHG